MGCGGDGSQVLVLSAGTVSFLTMAFTPFIGVPSQVHRFIALGDKDQYVVK
jgi:hypothetical protein